MVFVVVCLAHSEQCFSFINLLFLDGDHQMASATKLVCCVCSDAAIGFNYSGLPTCMACRVFFFRNASKRAELECFNKNLCNINKETRGRCSKCRLEKCFEIGMTLAGSELAQVGTLPSQEPSCRRPFQLTDEELANINQISKSTTTFFASESTLPVNGERQTVQSIIDRPAVYLHKLIRYLSDIAIILKQPMVIKQKILRGFHDQFTALRYAFQFDPLLDAFIVLHPNEKETVCIKRTHYKEVSDERGYEECSKIIRNLNRLLLQDDKIRDLVIAILLSKQLADNIMDESLRQDYNVKCNLLKRYLEDRFDNENRANEKYNKLIYSAFNDLAILSANYYRWVKQYQLHHRDKVFRKLATLEVYQVGECLSNTKDQPESIFSTIPAIPVPGVSSSDTGAHSQGIETPSDYLPENQILIDKALNELETQKDEFLVTKSLFPSHEAIPPAEIQFQNTETQFCTIENPPKIETPRTATCSQQEFEEIPVLENLPLPETQFLSNESFFQALDEILMENPALCTESYLQDSQNITSTFEANSHFESSSQNSETYLQNIENVSIAQDNVLPQPVDQAFESSSMNPPDSTQQFDNYSVSR